MYFYVRILFALIVYPVKNKSDYRCKESTLTTNITNKNLIITNVRNTCNSNTMHIPDRMNETLHILTNATNGIKYIIYMKRENNKEVLFFS